VEFVPDYIAEDRMANKDDIEQPHRKGHLNKKWVELHGTDKARRQGYSEKEIKEATYVYQGDDPLHYYSEGDK
jgi:hypothetical protein